MNCTNCGKFISITGKWEMLALFKKNQWHCTSRNGKAICFWFVCSTLTKYTQWRRLEISPNLPCFVSPPQTTIKSSFLPKLQRMHCYVVKYNYCLHVCMEDGSLVIHARLQLEMILVLIFPSTLPGDKLVPFQ